MERIWVLGASDPEMTMIEEILTAAGEKVAHAVLGGKRVSPPTAYKADGYQFVTDCDADDDKVEFMLVECDVTTPDGSPSRIIDHHREGDPGFGREPQAFLAASSIGQVVGWISDVPGPDTLPFEKCDDLIAEGPHYGSLTYLPDGRWVTFYVKGLTRLVVPLDVVVCAAADHCLGAAYQGRCPGVDPGALMAWCAASRAAFQGRGVEEILADVEATTKALREAPILSLWGERIRDMRREPPYPELPEAATRLGVPYISGPLVDRDGRRKITVSGGETVIRAFLETWAPAQGLVSLYGDPARGFAGGYLPE